MIIFLRREGLIGWIIYYIIVPLVFIYVSWKVKGLRTYILEVKRRLSYMFNNRSKLKDKYLDFYIPKYKDYLQKNTDKMKKIQIYLVVALIILLPAWHFSISNADTVKPILKSQVEGLCQDRETP